MDMSAPMDNSTTAEWCPMGGSVMFNGFSGLTQGPYCSLFLFQGGALDSNVKFAFAWIGTVLMSVLVDAIVYARRKYVLPRLAGSPTKRRVADSLLYAVQITDAYLIMLIVMLYSGPLFAAVVLGLTAGHAYFTDYADPESGMGDGTCCNPEEPPASRGSSQTEASKPLTNA